MLQAGNHSLENEITILNISEFKIFSSPGKTTRILCESEGKLTVANVGNASISGLTFCGCGGSTFTDVNQLLIFIYWLENSPTALMLNSTSSTRINNCYSAFLYHKEGSYHSSFGVSGRVGGAIAAYEGSNVSIDDSVFTNNSAATYGGVFYAEQVAELC